MNKKAQNIDFEQIIMWIIAMPVIIAILGAVLSITSSIGSQNCPTCDCSQYQNQNSNLTKQLELCRNQSKKYVYVNQTVEVPVEVIKEVPTYKDTAPTQIIISISMILSIILTFYLFKIEIDLPKDIKDKIKRIDKWIVRAKWISFGVTVILLIWGIVKFFMFIWNLF